MIRYKLTIAYDGTSYCGWQVQRTGISIQFLIQKALQTALRCPRVDLTGAGRTDAGVHARGQTAHFDALESIDPSRLLHSLNALLPPDVRILRIDPVPLDFHARYNASAKIYHYHLHLDSVIDPFLRLYRHHVYESCDPSRIKKAIPYFLGTHDFLSFANRGNPIKGPSVRTLFRLDSIEQKGGIRLEFEGSGFLYKMVRNITGLLLDIGSGKLTPEEIPSIFEAKDRRRACNTAPPHGLFLMEVLY